MAIPACSSPPPAKTSTPMSKARTAGAAWVRPTADGNSETTPSLMTDFEYQHKVERSEAGYQLLGGTTVPAPVYPSVMLGFQPWSKPNTFDTFNAGARLRAQTRCELESPLRWLLQPLAHRRQRHLALRSGARRRRQLPLPRLAATTSSAPTAATKSTTTAAPANCASMPSEKRCVLGHFTTGKISHDVVGGGSLFHRSVDLSPTIVYTPLGVENVYQPNIPYAPGRPLPAGRPLHAGRLQSPGLRHRAGARSSPRPRRPAGRRPIRAGHRLQLHRASNALAAAVRSHLLARCTTSCSTATTVPCFRLGPRPRGGSTTRISFLTPFMTRQIRDRREIRTRNSAHRRALPHAPALLLSQGHRRPPTAFCRQSLTGRRHARRPVL